MTSTMTPLHAVTPLLQSVKLSQLLPGCDVVLKMESAQISGSFKMRGIGNRCQQAILRGSERFVTASGGNAGLALARSAKLLNVPCIVFVPKTTTQLSIDRLKADGVEVVVHGENFNSACKRAIEEGQKHGTTFIHPYDHPDVWDGNASLVHELVLQLPAKPSVIVTSIGGGGLLLGLLQGMRSVGWSDVPVVAMETYGANCFNLSVKANKVVPLEEITSIAVTLSARVVCEELMRQLPEFNVISEVVTDPQAVFSCLQFADDEKTIVEPSCGAALAAIYCGVLRRLEDEGRLSLRGRGPVVMVVCGGTGVSMAMLQNWATDFKIVLPSQESGKAEQHVDRHCPRHGVNKL